jgi:hypothetical protein
MSIVIRLEEDMAVIEISRKSLFDWLTGEAQRRDTQVQDEPMKLFSVPDDSGSDKPKSEPQTSVDVGKGVDLFETKNGIGGALQDANGGSAKIQEMKKWMKDNKFSYRNFCLYLIELKEIAGWPLSKPLIGLTQKGEPTLFQVATRYYSFWKSQQAAVAMDYKQFLRGQVEAMGFTIEQAAEVLDGEVIDPSELPDGTEVSV